MADHQLTISSFGEQFPECMVCGKEHRCVICGELFKPRMHNPCRPQVTCGKKECQRENLRRRLEAAREAKKLPEIKCEICHEMFAPRDTRQKTCGKPKCIKANRQKWFDEYHADRRVKRDPTICQFCHEEMTPYGKRTDHCGKPKCKTAFESRQAKVRREKKRDALPPKQNVCAWGECRRTFTPTHSSKQMFCSEECREKYWEKQRKEKYWATKEEQNKKSKAYYERNKARLAEAERLLRLRSPDEIVEAARVTVAAGLQIDGLSKRAMRNELFPKQHDADRRYDDTKQFFRRKQHLIETEIIRLKGLSDQDRAAAITNARSHL